MSVHHIFGIEMQADVDLPGAQPNGAASGAPVVTLHRVADLGRGGLEGPASWTATIEARRLVTCSSEPQLAISWGPDCYFRFERATGTLEWSAPDPDAPAWQRLVLDTVAYLVALEMGAEALHAAGVSIEGVTVAVAARSGMGKSTLVSTLVSEGARLVSDDILAVELAGTGACAHPGPPLMNVPADRALPDRPVLDAFGSELWTEVPSVEAPQPLSALVVLERAPGVDERVERVAPSPIPVVTRLLAYPRTRERERRRFELAADLADRVPIYRLIADTVTTPEMLGETLVAIARQSDRRPAEAHV